MPDAPHSTTERVTLYVCSRCAFTVDDLHRAVMDEHEMRMGRPHVATTVEYVPAQEADRLRDQSDNERTAAALLDQENRELARQRYDEQKRAEQAESRLRTAVGALEDLIERVERDRREPDKILCDVLSAKSALASLQGDREAGDG